MNSNTSEERRNHPRGRLALGVAVLVLVVAASLILLSQPLVPFAFGLNNTPSSNYENVTVWTRINVTNAKPEVLSVAINDAVPGANLTLLSGGVRTIWCNATIRDWNGIDGNISANATFFLNGTAYSSPVDNNSHYFNSTCTNVTGPYGQNGIYVNYTCGFDVFYYATAGLWNCTVGVLDLRDGKNYTSFGWNNITMGKLYSVNLTDGIDYGAIAVGEYSNLVVANITNFGNMPINITVQGYGGVIGDAQAFLCNTSVSVWNISSQFEAFSINSAANFTTMINLTGGVQLIPNFTMLKQTLASSPVVNSTNWQVYIPPSINPSGECTGNVIFAAKAT